MNTIIRYILFPFMATISLIRVVKIESAKSDWLTIVIPTIALAIGGIFGYIVAKILKVDLRIVWTFSVNII